MECRETIISAAQTTDLAEIEVDMSILDNLVSEYNKRPEESFTKEDFAKRVDIAPSTSGKFLLALVKEGKLLRGRFPTETDGWEYVYWANPEHES